MLVLPHLSSTLPHVILYPPGDLGGRGA